MNTKTCPACGEVIDSGAARCPRCGLEGLNQIFLSHGDYARWREEALEPHMDRLKRRLFASDSSLLILTQGGQLYGMGNNCFGQLQKNGPDTIPEPVLMESDVVSASVSSSYSIFATRDGSIHIRGNGPFADRVPLFSDAKEVFVSAASFYIVNAQGAVLCFGQNIYDQNNRSEKGSLAPRQTDELMRFETITVKMGPFYNRRMPDGSRQIRQPSLFDDDHAQEEIRRQILQSKAYQEFAEFYGAEYLYIDLHMTKQLTDQQGDAWWITYQASPRLLWENTVIENPIFYHDQSFADTARRFDTLPVFTFGELFVNAHREIKKASSFYNNSSSTFENLAVCHDGSLVWEDAMSVLHRLDWSMAPVSDLAVLSGPQTFAVSCRDGSVYMADIKALPAIRILREIKLP